MENEFISRREFSEYSKRMEDEHKRQNKRLDECENIIKQNNQLTISVEKMAVNMEQMLNEQKEQGKRLTELESRDGKKWRAVASHVGSTILGAVVAYLLVKLGLQ